LRYRFAHALVRDALYQASSALRRSREHQRTAEAMEALHASALEAHYGELAHHYAKASAPEAAAKAVWYATLAGQRAAAVAAHAEAASFFRLALNALSRDASPERCDLLLALGSAEWRSGHTPAARATFLAASDDARARGDVERLADAALGAGGVGTHTWWYNPGFADPVVIGQVEEALERLPPGDSDVRARLLAFLAQELYFLDGHKERV